MSARTRIVHSNRLGKGTYQRTTLSGGAALAYLAIPYIVLFVCIYVLWVWFDEFMRMYQWWLIGFVGVTLVALLVCRLVGRSRRRDPVPPRDPRRQGPALRSAKLKRQRVSRSS